MKHIVVVALLCVALTQGGKTWAEPVTIKVATILPQGGPWAAAMARFAADVKRQTNDQVIFKLYFGAVAGTDQRALARVRANQIQGLAAATASLSELEPSLRLLELPMLFRSYDEFRFVLHSLKPELRERLSRRGYTLLGMAGVGWVQIYSKRPIRSMADFQNLKIWRWNVDPMAATLFQMSGVRGQLMAPGEVLPALQAGTLDTVYGMPHIVHALQWHTTLSYVLDLKISMAVAGVLIRKDVFDRLTPAQQKIVMKRAEAMETDLNTSCNTVNEASTRAMQAAGMKSDAPTPGFMKELQEVRTKVWGALERKLFQPADLKRVQSLLTLCRNTSCRF